MTTKSQNHETKPKGYQYQNCMKNAKIAHPNDVKLRENRNYKDKGRMEKYQVSPRTRKQELGIMVRKKEQSHLTTVAVVALVPEATREHMGQVGGDKLWRLASRMELPLSMPVDERPRQHSSRIFSLALLLAIVTEIPQKTQTVSAKNER